MSAARLLAAALVAAAITATPALAAFTHESGNRGNGARAAAVFKPVLSAAPTITGEGGTFTADRGTWGRQPDTLSLQWQRCDAEGRACDAVAGATALAYEVTAADVGSRLRVRVTATNAGGSVSADSAVTDPITAAPTTTVVPAISGTARVDELLSASAGQWTGSPTSVAYQWLRCTSATACTDIPGETASAYRLEGADAARTIRVRVTASNAGGSASVTSGATGAVARRSFTQILCSNPDTGYGVGTDGVLPDGLTKVGAWQSGWTLRSYCAAGIKTDLTRGVRIDGVSTASSPVWTSLGGWLQYRPLPGITLAPQGGTIYRRVTFGGGTKLLQGVHYGATPSLYGTPWQERCSQLYGGCPPAGTPATPYTGTALPISGAGPGFTAYLACEGNATGSCTATGSTGFFLYGGKLQLQDAATPVVSAADGSLVGGGPVPGDTASVTLSATDAGTGLYRVRVRIDEQPVAASVVDAHGGRCADANPSNAEDYEFASQKPCAAALTDARVEFDSSAWPRGDHRLHVLLEDASGNTVTLAKRTVQIGG